MKRGSRRLGLMVALIAALLGWVAAFAAHDGLSLSSAHLLTASSRTLAAAIDPVPVAERESPRAACEPTAASTPPPFALRLRSTRAPIAGAEVRVARVGAGSSTVRTDADGRFELDDWERVDACEAWGDGFFPREFLVADLRAAHVVDGARWLDVDPAGELVVEVVAHDGRPAAQASVRLFPAERLGGPRANTRPKIWPLLVDAAAWSDSADIQLGTRGVTGADGTVTVPLVPCGRPLWVAVLSPAGEVARTVLVPDDARAARVLVELPRNATLTGRFVYPDGQPIERGTVHWASATGGDFGSPRAHTDRDGRFALTGVPAGPQTYLLDLCGQELRTVDVVAPVTDVGDLVVERPVRLTGELAPGPYGRSEGNDALSIVVERDRRVLARQIVDREGRFDLLVTPGPAEVTLRDREVVLDRARVELPGAPLVLDPSARTACLEFEADPKLPVDRMTIEIAPHGRPHARAETVVVHPARVVSPQPGSFRIAWLPTGTKDVRVAFDGVGAARYTQVEFAEGGVTRLGRVDPSSGGIAGVLRDAASGAPVAAARVVCRTDALVTPRNGAVREATTDARGSFGFAGLDAGSWTLHLPGSGVADASARCVDVRAGATADVDWAVASPRSLRVEVTGDGGPIAGATVHVASSSSARTGFNFVVAETDERGFADFENLAPTEYLVSVVREATQRAAQSRSRRVVVGERDDARVRVEFASRATRVRLSDGGRPFAFALNSRVYGPDGDVPLMPIEGEPGVGLAYLGRGPWLVLATPAIVGFSSGGADLRSQPRLPTGYATCLVGSAGQEAPEELPVDLRGPGFVHDAPPGSEGIAFQARVAAWPGGTPAWLPDPCPTLFERDARGRWRAPYAPLGVELIVQPARGEPGPAPVRVRVCGDAETAMVARDR